MPDKQKEEGSKDAALFLLFVHISLKFSYNLLMRRGRNMEEEYSLARFSSDRRQGKKIANPSTDKPLRTMLLAVLFQVSWPRRLTKQEITSQLPFYGESARQRALYRRGSELIHL